jgi:uncharacterized membrane protein
LQISPLRCHAPLFPAACQDLIFLCVVIKILAQTKKNNVMEIIATISLIIHIIAGTSTLIAGPIALFYQKKNRLHRIAGKVFMYAMVVVIITSVFTFLRLPHVVFYQFLFAISIMVSMNIWQGVRSILFMKGQRPGVWDRRIVWFFILTGGAMLNAAAWYFLRGGEIALPILFAVFGIIVLADSLKFRRFLEADYVNSQWWLRLHILGMMAAFIASSTAFTVNAAHFLPWYLQWFGPAIILQPLVFYYLRQRKLLKKDLGKPFRPTEALA